MENSLQAIKTTYLETTFKSKLEARWAYFFEKTNTLWDYEPERFTLSDGGSYLPDFYLPEHDLYFEIKGSWPNDEYLDLLKRFAVENDTSIVVAQNILGMGKCMYFSTEFETWQDCFVFVLPPFLFPSRCQQMGLATASKEIPNHIWPEGINELFARSTKKLRKEFIELMMNPPF